MIIPVSSGKGGVGKSTLALNLALNLSRSCSTVLVDLDPGTSSLSSFFNMPARYNLYHFLKKNIPLHKCMVPLNRSLDPEKMFPGFYLIASPPGYIEEIVNFDGDLIEKLRTGLSSLSTDYVILDSKAGLDRNVLSFLPHFNSGILVFTPRVKAAVQTAVEMIRASLFQGFRRIMTVPGDRLNVLAGGKSGTVKMISRELDKAAASLKSGTAVFDGLLEKIYSSSGDTLLLRVLQRYISSYRVFFVLNRFDSISESAENIIRPFLGKIERTVSSSIKTVNLGWVAENHEVSRSAEIGLPYLMIKSYRRKKKSREQRQWENYLRDLALEDRKKRMKIPETKLKQETAIDRQLDLLNRMFAADSGNNPENSFDFLVQRLSSFTRNTSFGLGLRKYLTDREILEFLEGWI